MSGPFANYPEERLRIASVHSRCDEAQKRLRLAVLDGMLAAGGPVRPADVAADAGLEPAHAEELAAQMARDNVLVLGEGGEVRFAYPVSGLSTPHQVTLADGRGFSAMCVIDAMGSSYTFRQDADIASKCHRCGAEVRITMCDGEVALVEPADARVVHVDLAKAENWAASC